MKIIQDIMIPALIIECDCGLGFTVFRQEPVVACEECGKRMFTKDLVEASDLFLLPEDGDEEESE